MKLEGRVAIVTGAGQGIGRAIAEKLRAEGASVVVADKNAETAEKTAAEIGGTAQVTDVSDPDQVSALVAATVGQFGKVDILVNDAAIVPFVPWEELDFAEWRRVMSVNIDGVFLTCKAVYPHMKEAGYGRIVNICSNVVTAGTPNMAHYVSSKGAVFSFTRSLATEVGAHGITVNAVAARTPRRSTSWCRCSRSRAAASRPTSLPRWPSWPRRRRTGSPARCSPPTAATPGTEPTEASTVKPAP